MLKSTLEKLNGKEIHLVPLLLLVKANIMSKLLLICKYNRFHIRFTQGRYFNKILKTEKKIVLFCTLGARGALAAKTLKDMGYENVYYSEKGLQDWMK